MSFSNEKSDVCKEDVVGSLVPVVLLSVVIRARAWRYCLYFLEAQILALEDAVILEHLHLALLSMFFLDLLDDVVILVLFLLLDDVSEPRLANAEAWLLNDEAWVFFLLFDDSCCDVAGNDVVAADGRSVLLVLYEFPLEL